MQIRHINQTNQSKVKSIIQLYISSTWPNKTAEKISTWKPPIRKPFQLAERRAQRLLQYGFTRVQSQKVRKTHIIQRAANTKRNINFKMCRDSVKARPKTGSKYRVYKHVATNLHVPRAKGGSRSW